MGDIDIIKTEHYEANRHKEVIAIVKEDNGQFGIYQQTEYSVAPYILYPTARLAAARVLQLLGIGPVAPQYEPEVIACEIITPTE